VSRFEVREKLRVTIPSAYPLLRPSNRPLSARPWRLTEQLARRSITVDAGNSQRIRPLDVR